MYSWLLSNVQIASSFDSFLGYHNFTVQSIEAESISSDISDLDPMLPYPSVIDFPGCRAIFVTGA